MIWRGLYTLLGWLLMPLLIIRLYWRGRKNPGYRENIGERFGRYCLPAMHDVIWIHAVSVGETRAAAPLIARLEKQFPQTPIVLTCMTATGRATGAALYGARVIQVWLPYDYRFAVRRFLAHFKPRIVLLMETEVWPNVIGECRRAGIPCFLINARMSARSMQRYQRFASFTRSVFAALNGVAAQTKDDAARLITLGAANVAVTGNLKFGISAPETMLALGKTFRERFADGNAPVWVIASTRDGEEALILDAFIRHADKLPENLRTIIVPRHPERFAAVAALLNERRLVFIRRSENQKITSETRFILGDSMGELFAYYAAADIAFVGGSLLPFGGQNLLESISVGTPTLIGTHTFNFQDTSVAACQSGAARRVHDADELIMTVAELLNDQEQREAMRQAGQQFLTQHQGATEKLMAWLKNG